MAALSSTKIINLAKRNDAEALQKLVDEGIVFNQVRKSDRKLIIDIAADSGSLDAFYVILQEMMSRGSIQEKILRELLFVDNFISRDDNDKSGPAMQTIIDNNMVDAFRDVVERFPNIVNSRIVYEFKDVNPFATSYIPLLAAVIDSGNIEMTKILLENGAIVNAADGEFGVPLSWYASKPEIASMLYDYGRDDSKIATDYSMMEFIFNRAIYTKGMPERRSREFKDMYAFYEEREPHELERSQNRSGEDAFFFEIAGKSDIVPSFKSGLRINAGGNPNPDVHLWRDVFISMIENNDIYDDRLVLRTLLDMEESPQFYNSRSRTASFDVIAKLAEESFEVVPFNGITAKEAATAYIVLAKILGNNSTGDDKEKYQKLVMDTFLVPLIDDVFANNMEKDFVRNVTPNMEKDFVRNVTPKIHGENPIFDVAIQFGTPDLARYISDRVYDREINALVTKDTLKVIIDAKKKDSLDFLIENMTQANIDKLLTKIDVIRAVNNNLRYDSRIDEVSKDILRTVLESISDSERSRFFLYDDSERNASQFDRKESVLADFIKGNRSGYLDHGDTGSKENVFSIYVDNLSFKDVLNIGQHGESAIHLAASCENLDMLKKLVERFGTECLLIEDNFGNKPLHKAIETGMKDAIDYIISATEDLSVYTKESYNILLKSMSTMSTFSGFDSEFMPWLYDKYGDILNLDILSVDENGVTFAHKFAEISAQQSLMNETMINELVTNGVDFSLRDNDGKNPLFYYVENIFRSGERETLIELSSPETLDVFEKFIIEGANPCDIDVNGKHFLTPIVDLIIEVSKERYSYMSNNRISPLSNLISSLVRITEEQFGEKLDIASICSSDGKISLYESLLLVGAIKGTNASEAPMSVSDEYAVLGEYFTYLPNVAHHMISYFKKNFCCAPEECEDSREKTERYIQGMEKAIDGMNLNDSIRTFQVIEKSRAIGEKNIQRLYDKIFERYPEIHTYAIGSKGSLLISALDSERPSLVKQLLDRGADASMPVFIGSRSHGFTTPIRYLIEKNKGLSSNDFSENFIRCMEYIVSSGALVDDIPMVSAAGTSAHSGIDASYLLDDNDVASLYAMIKSTYENSGNETSGEAPAPAPKLRI